MPYQDRQADAFARPAAVLPVPPATPAELVRRKDTHRAVLVIGAGLMTAFCAGAAPLLWPKHFAPSVAAVGSQPSASPVPAGQLDPATVPCRPDNPFSGWACYQARQAGSSSVPFPSEPGVGTKARRVACATGGGTRRAGRPADAGCLPRPFRAARM